MTSDDWAVFSHDPSAVSSPNRAQILDELAARYEDARAQKEAVTTLLDALTEEIARLFPESEGDFTHTGPNYMVRVTRDETHSWDKKMLQRMFDGDAAVVPAYITKTYGVDKKKWESMPPVHQDLVRDALTRKLSKPKIKVTKTS